MMRSLIFRSILVPILLLVSFTPARSHDSSGLIKDGDRWVFLGDSITAQNTYLDVVKQVFHHYHPEATLTLINSGSGGDRASSDPAKLVERVLQHQPTVVSVMYGMNEAINNYCIGKPKEQELRIYRDALTYIAATLKAKGITVMLLSPTLTDPSAHSFFNLDKSQEFLRECAAVVKKVAEEQGVFYVPVQEELEAFESALPMGAAITPDGVHPASLGHYQIARSLWKHGGVASTLARDKRETAPIEPETPVTAKLASRFIPIDSAEVNVILDAPAALAVKAIWSFGELRGEETLKLTQGSNRWTIPIPSNQFPSRNGQSKKLIFNMRAAEADRLFIIDLCRTQVLHFENNRIEGSIESEVDRDDGKHIANWRAERVGDSLMLDFEVFDKEISSDGVWPFTRDGLNLMLDYRPSARFADIGVDREVTQLFLDVREEPFFSVGLRAWTGSGADFAATAAGTKTAQGYKVQLLINQPFKLHTSSKLSDRDFVGLLIAVDDSPGPRGPGQLMITPNQKNDGAVNDYANNLPIIDLNNKLPGDATINAHLFPAP